MSCHCESCSTSPAPTYTESYRARCEAEEVARWAEAMKLDYYTNVLKHRGAEQLERLRRNVARVSK